ncbi:MAG: alpha/beta fold hydrolase, partial [Oscillochloris sp.]|nr:alpha/beta fold hydrolase [Oscillochloris sp.]
PDSTAGLCDMSVPTLVIVGEDDGLTPPSEAQAISAALAESFMVVIPAAGHISSLENPDAFTAALRTFLA